MVNLKKEWQDLQFLQIIYISGNAWYSSTDLTVVKSNTYQAVCHSWSADFFHSKWPPYSIKWTKIDKCLTLVTCKYQINGGECSSDSQTDQDKCFYEIWIRFW